MPPYTMLFTRYLSTLSVFYWCVTDFFYIHTSIMTFSIFSFSPIKHTSTFQMRVKIVLRKSTRTILARRFSRLPFEFSHFTLKSTAYVERRICCGEWCFVQRHTYSKWNQIFFIKKKEKCKVVDLNNSNQTWFDVITFSVLKYKKNYILNITNFNFLIPI